MLVGMYVWDMMSPGDVFWDKVSQVDVWDLLVDLDSVKEGSGEVEENDEKELLYWL